MIIFFPMTIKLGSFFYNFLTNFNPYLPKGASASSMLLTLKFHIRLPTTSKNTASPRSKELFTKCHLHRFYYCALDHYRNARKIQRSSKAENTHQQRMLIRFFADFWPFRWAKTQGMNPTKVNKEHSSSSLKHSAA